MIIYIWCMVEGIVPNFKDCALRTKIHIRNGRKCIVPLVKQSPYARIIGGSLRIHGAKLFNAMPRSIRNMTGCSKDSFKRKLDFVLNKVPDEPQTRRYTAYRRAESNSLLDMISLPSVGLYELDM